jgi:hypothetical protein
VNGPYFTPQEVRRQRAAERRSLHAPALSDCVDVRTVAARSYGRPGPEPTAVSADHQAAPSAP